MFEQFSKEEQAEILKHRAFEDSEDVILLKKGLDVGLLTSVEFSMKVINLAHENGLKL